jgi:hypothetical protein
MFVAVMNVVMFVVMIVIPVVMWGVHVWTFWCEWGRGQLDRGQGVTVEEKRKHLRVTFWRYTAWSFIPMAGLVLAYWVVTTFAAADAPSLVPLIAPWGYALLMVSLVRQLQAWDRLNELERQRRSEMPRSTVLYG